jgi:Leucine-rich repeat (LRR) protein
MGYIDSRTADVRFDSNAITSLPSGMMASEPMLSVRSVIFFKNAIAVVEPGAFRWFPNVESIDISQNSFTVLETGVFANLTKLRVLDVGFSGLTFFPAFAPLPALERIRIEHVPIINVSKDMFDPFPSAIAELSLAGLRLGSGGFSADLFAGKLRSVGLLDISSNTLTTLADGFLEYLLPNLTTITMQVGLTVLFSLRAGLGILCNVFI